MKLAIFVCVALLAVLLQAEDEVAPPVLPAGTRIANGRPATPRQFPFMAYIDAFNADGKLWSICAGSLITRSAVLTSALWCASSTAKRWTVRLGSIYRTGDDPNAWSVQSITGMSHPKYSDNNYDNNIAIIQLPKQAPVNEFIQPVPLLCSPVSISYIGREAIVAGWGRTRDVMSDVLRWAKVLVMHNDFCKRLRPSVTVTDRQLCAGSNDTTVSRWDYGVPLILQTRGRYKQIGVFSTLTNWTFNTPYPAIYSRITSYMDWIKLYTESECSKE